MLEGPGGAAGFDEAWTEGAAPAAAEADLQAAYAETEAVQQVRGGGAKSAHNVYCRVFKVLY